MRKIEISFKNKLKFDDVYQAENHLLNVAQNLNIIEKIDIKTIDKNDGSPKELILVRMGGKKGYVELEKVEFATY